MEVEGRAVVHDALVRGVEVNFRLRAQGNDVDVADVEANVGEVVDRDAGNDARGEREGWHRNDIGRLVFAEEID